MTFVTDLLFSPILWLTLTVLILSKVIRSYLHIRRLHKQLSGLPTVDGFHPLLGNIHKFAADARKSTEYVLRWINISRRVVVFWITSLRPIVTIYHPDLLKEVLPSSESKPFQFGDPLRHLKDWLGDGLATAEGKHWKRSRRLLTPVFHFDTLRPYVDVYNKSVDILLEKLDKLADTGESFDICPLLKLCSFDIILKCAMSVDLDVQRGTQDLTYMMASERVGFLAMDRMRNILHYFDTIYYRTEAGKEFKRNCQIVHKFADDVIDHRRKILEKEGPPQKRYLDLVDLLLTAKDEDGQGMDPKDIRAEVDTFLFAGHETTAITMGWLFHCLGENPQHQKLVQQEVDDILKDRDCTDILWSDLPKFEHLTCCMKESLRMYPIAPGVMRLMTKDVVIDGVVVPAGTRVLAHIILLHRNPDVYPEPEQFRPERFTKENSLQRSPFAFVPFAAGPRNCIGQNFAMNEMKVLAAKILQRFELSPDPSHPVDPVVTVNFHSQSGVWVYAKRRTPTC